MTSGFTAHPDPRRAAELGRAGPDPARIWPRLRLVSCWGDGPAKPCAAALGGRLPFATLQPKGLIATEAVVSIPWGRWHPLAIRSHVFEFLDAQGRSHLAHELETGRDYEVVVTTGAGLYRYRLGDRVRVNGWVQATPSVQFVGRNDAVSDRFGEKLSDGFVATVLNALFDGNAPAFAMLAPDRTAAGLAYTLFVEARAALSPTLADRLERELRRNPHYAWCVDLGQLRPARVVAVKPGADRAYIDECVRKGQRLGDVKPVSLHREDGWNAVLPRAT